jgi:hypothetical protein
MRVRGGRAGGRTDVRSRKLGVAVMKPVCNNCISKAAARHTKADQQTRLQPVRRLMN